jgi:hypothetical protein
MFIVRAGVLTVAPSYWGTLPGGSTHNYTLAGSRDRRLDHILGASPTARPFSTTGTSLSSLVFLSMDPLAIPVGNEERVVKVPRPEASHN